jgi:hypothetical protein
MDIAGQLDADPVRLADHGVARRRAERRSNGARAFSFERHLPQSFNRRIGPHIPRPSLLLCEFSLMKNVASPTPRWRCDAEPCVFQHRHRLSSRLYSMVNTTIRCVGNSQFVGICYAGP